MPLGIVVGISVVGIIVVVGVVCLVGWAWRRRP